MTDMHGWSALHWAAKRGDVGAIRALVAAGAPIDVRAAGSLCTPLMVAVHCNQTAAGEALLELKADVTLRTRGGSTASSLAKKPIEALTKAAPESSFFGMATAAAAPKGPYALPLAPADLARHDLKIIERRALASPIVAPCSEAGGAGAAGTTDSVLPALKQGTRYYYTTQARPSAQQWPSPPSSPPSPTRPLAGTRSRARARRRRCRTCTPWVARLRCEPSPARRRWYGARSCSTNRCARC